MTSSTGQSDVVTVALVMTVHNRRNTTERFFASLAAQAAHGFSLQVFITDDGSTDGTASMLASVSPSATVLHGDGSLYWAGGMRLALASARTWRPDFFLLTNDDVELDPSALARLSHALHQLRDDGVSAIIVGSTLDPDQSRVSYGGFRCPHSNRLLSERVVPSNVLQRADTFNANCALIPRDVMEALDGLEPRFSHALADLDFGLRARAMGFPIFVMPGYLGVCPSNTRSMFDGTEGLTVRQFWQRLNSSKNLPVQEWLLMTRRHGGHYWPLYAVGTYVKAFARYFWRRLTKKKSAEQACRRTSIH